MTKTLPLLGLGFCMTLISSCGQPFAGPSALGTPCETINKSAFDAALREGAAKGVVRARENGSYSLNFGAGIVQCASNKLQPRACRRPNDLVIEYTLKSGAKTYLKVPANQQYRFRLGATPTTCEVIK